MATSSARCESPGVDPWTCMPKHTNPQCDMLEHPIFALPHNRIHPYSDDALAALGRTPTLEAGRKSADGPAMGARDQIRRLSDGRPHRQRQGSTSHPVRTRLDGKVSGHGRGFRQLPVKTAYIDGELCGVRADGVTSFELMQQASDAGYGGLVYFAFDLLELDGEDVARLPLLERKERLAQLLQDPPAGIVYSEHEGGDGEAFRRAACRHGLEGVVSKRIDRPYLPGDRGAWVKSKCLNRAEFVVVGWSDPEGSRHLVGSLLLSYYNSEGRLIYAGRVGTGMSVKTLAMLHERLAPLATVDDAAVLTSAAAGAGSEARWPCPRCIGCDPNSSPRSLISVGPKAVPRREPG